MKKRLLIIEDSDDKFALLEDYLESALLTRRRSYQSGVYELISNSFDIVILDMTLPTYDVTENDSGYQLLPFGGEMVLSELKRRKISVPVVVVTQYGSFFEGDKEISFEDLTRRLEAAYADLVRKVIYLDAGNSQWKSDLRKFLG